METKELNLSSNCWKPQVKVKVELVDTKINGYAFGNVPKSYTEVYQIKKAPKKHQNLIGKKCYLWIDNDGNHDAQMRNYERCLTLELPF